MRINETLNEISKWLCLGSSEQCYTVMYTITRAFQVKRVLEIGTHQGASAITFCQAILDNKYIPEIWTLDNWIGIERNEQSKNLKSKAENYIKKSGFNKYINMIEGDSKIIVPLTFSKIGKVDLCFIDGDHNYEGVMADYQNCKDYTSLILFHDTGKGDIKYLKEIEKEWKIITFPTCYIEGDGHLVGISLGIKR